MRASGMPSWSVALRMRLALLPVCAIHLCLAHSPLDALCLLCLAAPCGVCGVCGCAAGVDSVQGRIKYCLQPTPLVGALSRPRHVSRRAFRGGG